MSNIINANDADFDGIVLQSDIPVLVDFWAEWCGPCKAIAPIIEEIANLYQGRVKVVKVDVQVNKDKAVEYQIRSIPTLLFFNKGELIERHTGSLPKNHLIETMDCIFFSIGKP